MNRRHFLQTSAIGAASMLAPAILRARSPRAVEGNRLRIPSAWNGESLVAIATVAEVWPGVQTDVWTYGGTWPGPTIRVRKGSTLSVRFTNQLDEETTVHWHGLYVPSDMDGHPKDPVAPGATFEYTFPILNNAGTYWYHPHPHGRTAAQAYLGMGGAIVVEDDEEQALDLPRAFYDVPLLLQDRYLDGARSFTYAPTSAQRLNGMLGDTVFVNGTPDAYHEVDAGKYRFRVVNGSNARIYKLGFADGRRFAVIASDGGLLDRPYEVTDTLLAPGERVEIVVDFADLAAEETVQLRSLPYGTATTPGQQGYELPVLTFVGTGIPGHTRALPATLVELVRWDSALASREQSFVLDTSPIPIGGHHHTINGVVFEMHRIDATVPAESLELWEIRNNHTMPHPIHIHGTQFQIVDRDGAVADAPRDRGWKDTVHLAGKEAARILVRFPYEGTFPLHCHNLEHEDDGMMINLEVTQPTGVDGTTTRPLELDLR